VSGGFGPALATYNVTDAAPYLGFGFEFPKHMTLQYDLIYLPHSRSDWVSVVRINVLAY
jgi:hypothetical protein